jgi:hypothetical protein
MYFVVNLKYFFRKKIYDSTTDNFLKDGFIQNNIPGTANEIEKLIKSKSKDVITTVLSKNDKGIKIIDRALQILCLRLKNMDYLMCTDGSDLLNISKKLNLNIFDSNEITELLIKEC